MRKLLFVLIFFLVISPAFSQDVVTKASPTYDNILVKKVISADILELENGEIVKLIGVSCPPKLSFNDSEAIKEYPGQRSYEFTKELVEGKYVQLEFDVQEEDNIGHLLAYVYIKAIQPEATLDSVIVGPDGDAATSRDSMYYYDSSRPEIFLNASIIKSGFATPIVIKPNVKYADLFIELLEEAKENKRGWWKIEGGISAGPQTEEFFDGVDQRLQKQKLQGHPMGVMRTMQPEDIKDEGDSCSHDGECITAGCFQYNYTNNQGNSDHYIGLCVDNKCKCTCINCE